MSESFRSKQLAMIILGQFNSYMLAIGWGAFSDVNSNIQDCTFDTTYQFALCKGWTLEMEASHHAIRGFTLIVLNKGYCMSEDWGYLLVELPLGEGFEEVSTSVFEYAGLNYQDAIYSGFDYVHVFLVIYLGLLNLIDLSTSVEMTRGVILRGR